MPEIRETDTHVVKERDGSRATPWLAFIIGVLLIAIVAFFFINARGSFTNGPGGQKLDFNVKGPAAPAAPAR